MSNSRCYRGRQLVELVQNDVEGNNEENCSSPLTTEQQKFFEEIENNSVLMQCYDDLIENSPTSLSTKESSKKVLTANSSLLNVSIESNSKQSTYNLRSKLHAENQRSHPLCEKTKTVEERKYNPSKLPPNIDIDHELINNKTQHRLTRSLSVNLFQNKDFKIFQLRSSSLPPTIRIAQEHLVNVSQLPSVCDPYATDSGSDSDWVPSQTARFCRNMSSPEVTIPFVSSVSEDNNSVSILESTNNEVLLNLDHPMPSSSQENSSEKARSRKRLRKANKWKREDAKKSRLEGKEYVSAVSKTKKIIEKREIKPACSENCKLKCKTKITEENRRVVFNNFWKVMMSWDQRRQFIASSIDLVPVNRPRHRQNNEVSRRKKTRIYNVCVNNQRIHVCQKMFLNTLSVTEQFISTTLSKTSTLTNIVEPDQRGKHVPANKTPHAVIEMIKNHILSFPRYTSHYSREKTSREYLGPEWNIAKMYNVYVQKCKDEHVSPQSIAKEWLYRKVFNEEFNFAFYSPSKDTCDICDKYTILLKQETDLNEKKTVEDMKEAHLKDAQNRYSMKKTDKEASKTSNGESLTLMLDMQKCLATPLLTNTESFYLRKLWVLNETIHDDTSNKSYCMMWNETLGGRGGNEVASCIIEWALNYIDTSVKEITIWSDNCTGQNRNSILLYCYFWLLTCTNLTVINHKFLLRGHTHSEVDMVHSIIERKKKELPQFEIMVPRDWEQFVKICKQKNPLIVHSMNLDNIRDVKSLSSHFLKRRKNVNQELFYISQCVWFQTRKEDNGVLYYKTTFEDKEFSKIDLRRHTRRQLNLPTSIPPCSSERHPISTAKYKDLQTLTAWMTDSTVKSYYANLPHGNVPDIVPLQTEIDD